MPHEYTTSIKYHIDKLAKESQESGTPSIICLSMHTFVSRTLALVSKLEKMLTRLRSWDNIRWVNVREVVGYVQKGGTHMSPSQELGTAGPRKANDELAQYIDKLRMWALEQGLCLQK